MRLTFLGTSHGVPAADRFCSSTMLEQKNGVYLMDAGAPVLDLLLRKNVDLNRVKALFTTHLHGDHVYGILEFTDLANWYFKDMRTEIFLTEESGVSMFKGLIAAMDGTPVEEERLKFRLMTRDTVYCDENIRVTPYPTRHMGDSRPCYSYLVEAEGKKVFFSGDLSFRLSGEDFPAYVLENRVDLLVLEMAHFGVEEAEPYLKRCLADRVCINHVFPVEKLEEIRMMSERLGNRIHAVSDGEVLEV